MKRLPLSMMLLITARTRYICHSRMYRIAAQHIAQHIDESRVLDDETDLLPNGDSFGEIDELLPTTVRTLSCGIN
jgi:hypothetical protein